MSKRIPLGKGKFAVVDNEDYPYLSRFKWCFIRKNGGSSPTLRFFQTEVSIIRRSYCHVFCL